MTTFKYSRFVSVLALLVGCLSLPGFGGLAPQEELLTTTAEPGRPGGRLAIGEPFEPKTLNPLNAVDQPSLDVIRRTMADLIHINRATLKAEPALAKSWTATPDGKTLTLQLRRGIRFSDGAPFDADDVVFSFQVYLDEKVAAPQRVLLLIDDKPIKVEKLGQYTVRFSFSAPYAVGERVFDSVPVLPRHLLEKEYQEGRIKQVWTLSASPASMAGLGPFRLKSVAPGERVVLERNPYYWKVDSKGQRLPYLDELSFVMVPNTEAQVIRFMAGDIQAISPLSADGYASLAPDQQKHHYKLYDMGAGLEFNFLFFNLNEDTEGRLPEVARKQAWFRDVRFRQAVSRAIDRQAIARLAYHNRATPLVTHVTPGDKLWFDSSLAAPSQSLPEARRLLQQAGFSWKPDGALVDSHGTRVSFSILANSGNAQQTQSATLIQSDLSKLGMDVHVVTLEFRATVDRILQSHDYDVAVMRMANGDADPNPVMGILTSEGSTHVWSMGEKKPPQWQLEIDRLMQQQMITLDFRKRKKLYDQVQQILAREVPALFLVSPNILVAARENLANVRPAIMDNYILWNSDELFWRTPAGK
ncbi:MAG TPA: ABC transporter substrate-binding protein [Candidatus Angelobacter sp.]